MLNVIHLDAKEVSSYFYYSALKILVKFKYFLLREGVKIVDISGSENTSFYLADVCIWIYLTSVSCMYIT